MPINSTVRGSFGAQGRFGKSKIGPFNSFGVVSPQTKPTFYTSYSGSDPSGPHATQLTRMTSKLSQRPGGLTYTDIVLTGDFFISFFSSHGSDYYNAIFFHANTYKDFTHNQLGGASTASDYGYQSQYGVYITPSGFDIWDGYGQPEGSGGTAGVVGLVSGMTTSGYIGIRRVAGKFYTYYSNAAPGSAGYANMTLIHGPSSSTYTDDVRLGIFVHDADDYLEVYSPGTYHYRQDRTGTTAECDGLGVTVANGADATNVTGYTNTSMTWYSVNRLNAGAANGRNPLDFSVYTASADFSFHTGHTFPDWWPMYFVVQVNASTPKVLNQIDWRTHANAVGNVDIFGSNRSITSSNFTDETLYTHLGRTKFGGSGGGGSESTIWTQTFNAAGLGYKWYLIKAVDGRAGTVVPYPYTDGHGATTATVPSGWAMYGLRLNKI
jgi:hypothetical protein